MKPISAASPKSLADSGYLSEANLAALADREISAYIATGRAKHPAEGNRKIKEPLTRAMRDKLRRAGWRSRMCEAAYIVFERDSFSNRQWPGWKAYMEDFIAREDFRDWWLRIVGEGDEKFAMTPGASQYDKDFEEFVVRLHRSASAAPKKRMRAAPTALAG